MKQMILTLAVAISSLFAYAGEANAKIDSDVLKAFNREFVSAQDVTWTVTNDYYKASFVFNNQFVAAYYDADGYLLGVTRNISSLELPVKLQAKLRKDYSKYWISGLTEVSNDEGTNYIITLENADQTVQLKSTDSNNWRIFKTVIKS